MKTIVAGSRSITDIQTVSDAVEQCGWTITEIVSGGATGVDTLGENIANAYGIPLTIMKAD
jgi:predicted Rossmann fold nucleotide-binding protein DprA/Smf involved in DNA uptake